MHTIPELASMFNYGTQMYGHIYHANPPTVGSIKKIQSRLYITVPSVFVEFAMLCPRYGTWFASIGDDYENHNHIIKLNELFHGTTVDSLPQSLIMFNHGYDGDCDCFDKSAPINSLCEHPIVYCSVSDGNKLLPPSKPIFLEGCFHEYLERWTIEMKSLYESYLKKQGKKSGQVI